MTRVLKDSMLLTVGEVAGALALLGLNIIVSRATGPEGKGEFTLVFGVAQVGSMFLGLRWERAVGYFLAKDERRLPAVLGSVLLIGVLVSVLGTLLWLVYPRVYSDVLLRGEAYRYIGLALVLMGVSFVLHTMYAVHNGLRDFKGSATYYCGSSITQIMGLGIVYLAGATSVHAYVVALLVAMVVWQIVWMTVWMAVRRVVPTLSASLMKTMARYSVVTYASLILDARMIRLDIFLINYLVQPVEAAAAQVGLYSVALGLSMQLTRLTNIAGQVVFTRRSADELGDASATATIVRFSLMLMLVGGVGLAIVGTPMIPILFGKEFVGATPAFWITIPAIIMSGIHKLLASEIDGRGRPAYSAVCSLVAAILTVVLSVLWIPAHGMIGVAWAVAYAHTAGCISMAALFCMLTGLGPWEAFRPRRSDWVLVAALVRKLRDRGRSSSSTVTAVPD